MMIHFEYKNIVHPIFPVILLLATKASFSFLLVWHACIFVLPKSIISRIFQYWKSWQDENPALKVSFPDQFHAWLTLFHNEKVEIALFPCDIFCFVFELKHIEKLEFYSIFFMSLIFMIFWTKNFQTFENDFFATIFDMRI